MWELDCKESWVQKNWCFWTVVLEKTLENPLYCKEIQPVHPKRDQSWVFIGRTDAEGETPILLLPDVENWLIWKEPDAGEDWGQEEKGMEDRGWDGFMASLTQKSWVWVNSWSLWWTRRPGVLQFMGSQRVGQTEWLDWTKASVWKWKLLSCVQLFVTPWTIQSVEFSRPDYWSGQSFPSPGDLPDLEIKPRSPAL